MAKFDPSKVKVVKRVTMPTLKLLPDVPAYVKITDKIFEGKDNKKKKDDNKKPPMVFNVINLETGEHMQMVAGAVVQSEIAENYENHSYVGKCFMIVKGKKKGTGERGYFTYEIAEIADPTAS